MLDQGHVLPHAIIDAASARGDALAMLDVAGRRRSFNDVRDEMMRWAGAYAALGVTPGSTVLTMVPNSFECYDVWLGLVWLRAIEVPANTGYRGPMLAYILNNSEAALAVISERYLDRLALIADDLVHLKCLVVPDASGPLPSLPFEVRTGDDVLAGAPSGGAPSGGTPSGGLGPGPAYHDIAAMIYTSGTTGPSKGVLVPWAELYQFVEIQAPESLDQNRGYYSIYPGFHVSGKAMLYFTVIRGGYLVIRETLAPGEFWNDVRTFDCQAAGLLGPIASLLMLAPPRPDDADSPLESVYMGPIIPEVEEFKKRFGVRVGTGFGMTEIGAPLTSDGFNLANGRSCGRARTGPPGYQCRIVDELDEPVAPGVVGELVVRSDDPWVLNAGYWRMPEKTAEAWRNGWFHTGDGFMCDEDGNFYFVDRLKDAIRRRGENISSFEVEAGINAHPSVAESAVIAVPSELGEDDVKALVVLRPGAQLDPRQLIEFLVPVMPRFMIPRYIEITAELPKTDATFRTQKARLREDPLNEHTWDREAAGIVLPKA